MSQKPEQIIPSDAPFAPEQIEALNAVFSAASPEQAAWLKGFFAGAVAADRGFGGGAGKAQGAAPSAAPEAAPAAESKGAVPLVCLFGSESGNAEGLADKAAKKAAEMGFDAKTVDMADAKVADLAKAENLLVVISTWGEGDPPSRAEDFYEHFMNDQAPKLSGVRFSVCGLGDTSYEHFCQMGKDFDKRLEALGAERVYDRVDCDVDFEEPSERWLDGALGRLKEVAAPAEASASEASAANGAAPAEAPAAAPEAPAYGKRNPFPAPLLSKINLNGTGSTKETIHAEVSIEGSGLSYEPGDALAVLPQNPPDLIEDFLETARLEGRENVAYKERLSMPFVEVLREHLDLRVVTKTTLQKYAKLSNNPELLQLCEDRDKVGEYAWGRDFVDVMKDYPPNGLGAGDWISLLRPLAPRLYSIASSLKAHPDEVHLTVASVRYETHGRPKKGVASTFIADMWQEGESAPVYFHHNKNFKLPKDGDTPIIMVGPGTGIAPFRAFIEERAADGAKGRNWLFFGDQHFLTDFLYQTEWQDYLKKGALHKLDLAFSRDQPDKIYVQDRMRENAKELWSWIDEGAYFYVCGDASRMAKDVHQALHDVVEKQGGMNPDDAAAYVKKMQKERRYARDVY